jgi:hypothetical protein
MRSFPLAEALAAISLVALGACSDSSSPNSQNIRPVSLSFSSQAPAGAAPIVNASRDVIVTVGANTLIITKAQVVVRSIKLKTTQTMACSDDDSIDDDCDEVRLAPMLVDLPLAANGVTTLTATIPEGTYREISFKIHKPSDNDASDIAFRAANPTFATTSMRVEGTFNGQAFVYTSDMSETTELEFAAPVIINADNKNVTVQFNLSSWFTVNGQVINPTTANKGGANENAVKGLVRGSLRALDDDDKNGR